MIKLEDTYSTAQTAEVLEISESSLKKLAADGVFKPSSKSAKKQYSVEDVQALAVFFLLRKEKKNMPAKKAAQVAKRAVSSICSSIIPLGRDAPTGMHINVEYIKNNVIGILLEKFCHE